jgi:CxxC motif-containing protein
MGCRLLVWADKNVVHVEDSICKRGLAYGEQEFTNPMRMVTSLVTVESGKRPVCAVKTKSEVPKAKIWEVLHAIGAVTMKAPVRIGQVVIGNVADTGVDLIATADCGRAE